MLDPKFLSASGLLLSVFSATALADVTLYAQANLGFLFADDGTDSLATLVDNDAGASRFGVLANVDVSPAFRLGAHAEFELQYNPSNEVDLMGNDHIVPESSRERHLSVFARGTWGKVSIGRGDGAANGNLQRDLSGTALISFADPERIGGSIGFQDVGTATTVTIAESIRDQDFEHRYTRLRYDAPKFGSLATTVSYGRRGGNDVYEVGVRIGSQYELGKMQAAAGYSLEDQDDGSVVGSARGNNITTGGSFSFLANSGLNLTLAFSIETDQDPANPDSKYGMAKLGYIRGKHAVSVSYLQNNDRAQQDDESSVVTLGYVHEFSEKLDLYAGYKVHSLKRSGADFDDVSIGLIGARYKFQFKPFSNQE